MRLNRFRLRIIIQSILIAFTGYFAVNVFLNEHLWLTRITLLLVWIGLVYNIILYTSRTNERLKNFLASLNYLDTLPADNDGDASFRELNLTLNDIIYRIKETEKDKEVQSVFFKNTVEHISTGLIVFNKLGDVNMYNKAARQLLKIPVLSSINKLDTLKAKLASRIYEIQPGENLLSAIIIRGELHRIVFRKAVFRIGAEELNILSLQDIRSQLEEEELETWKKLISILRHEIMNSVAPINSLSLSLKKITEKIKKEVPEPESEMLIDGLQAISKRSDGLMNFVRAYKTLTSVPSPKFSDFKVKKLIEECIRLFKPAIEEQKIRLKTSVDEKLVVTADYNLISQVIINLIKNAMEAMENKDGELGLCAYKNENGFIDLIIKDNGDGISEDQLENIFLPFFTTKEKGSGIGLSLARQIMRLHKGNIHVRSNPGKGSEFILSF